MDMEYIKVGGLYTYSTMCVKALKKPVATADGKDGILNCKVVKKGNSGYKKGHVFNVYTSCLTKSKFICSMRVEGRLNIEVEAATPEEAFEKAKSAFVYADLSGMEVVDSEPVNCTDEAGKLTDR